MTQKQQSNNTVNATTAGHNNGNSNADNDIEQAAASIQIDASGLYKTHHTHLTDAEREQYKEQPTPLTEALRQRIQVRGPMTIAQYMGECLTHPLYGYYSRKEHILPSPSASSTATANSMRGDFITSPEVSQVYGELLCLWFILVWTQLGEPPRIQFIELGPVSSIL